MTPSTREAYDFLHRWLGAGTCEDTTCRHPEPCRDEARQELPRLGAEAGMAHYILYHDHGGHTRRASDSYRGIGNPWEVP